MTLLEQTIANIAPPDTEAAEKIRAQLAAAIHNPSELGDLTTLLTDYAAITGSTTPEKPKKCTSVQLPSRRLATFSV